MWQPVSPVENILVSAVIALIPIVWIFVGMLKLKLPSYKAGVIALALGVLIGALIWKMPINFIWQAVAEGTALGLWPILWVIFAAILTYNISVKSGGMDRIKEMLSRVSPDRRIQALILAFAFGGFLEAAAGFGTAVAIPASILAALGFEPLFAAVICLVANTIPVAFGAVGIPIITLGKVTGLPLDRLTLYTSLQLLPFVIILPVFLVILTTGSLKGAKGVVGISFVSGIAFGIGQTFTSWAVGPELAAVVGSLLSLTVLIVWVRLFPVKKPWNFLGEEAGVSKEDTNVKFLEGLKAWSPYIIILVLVLATRLMPFLAFLSKPPFVISHRFYYGPGGKPLSFSLITNPGTIIIVSAVLSGIIQGLSLKEMLQTALSTLKQIGKTIVTVISIVSLAKLMGYSGMTSSIAVGLSIITGSFFPLISPLIGALGTFITGSDTSANVLFGELQKQTAIQINSNPEWITAANASGATAGKMISPQSIAIATAATGLSGVEGKILKRTVKYSFAFVVLLGTLVFFINLAL